MTDKTRNKERKMTFRLTPHQSLMLEVMSEQLEVTKSSIMRYILDDFISKYERADE